MTQPRSRTQLHTWRCTPIACVYLALQYAPTLYSSLCNTMQLQAGDIWKLSRLGAGRHNAWDTWGDPDQTTRGVRGAVRPTVSPHAPLRLPSTRGGNTRV